MIRYVQNKPINYARIEQLLDQSRQAGVFTNNGPVKQLLEKKLETLFGLDKSKRVVCTSSGASALYVLMNLFEKKLGKKLKWVTPAFNFPAATVNRLDTEILDIELEGYSLPLSCLSDYDGIVITTLFGTLPLHLPKIITYCQNNNKILILDNASSPLTNLNNQNINSLGSAAIGSLHHTKYLGFAEGGFAVIPHDLYNELNALTNFGFNDARKYCNYASNAKMSDVSAAFALSHIESYDIEKHLKIQQTYISEISNLSGVKVFNLSENPQDKVVYGNMPVVFAKPINHLVFRDVGIEANKYYAPLKPLPNSQNLFDRIINFPLYSDLSDYDLDMIFKKIGIEAKKCS